MTSLHEVIVQEMVLTPRKTTTFLFFTLEFLYGLVSFGGAGRETLLPLNRATQAVAPVFSLYAKLNLLPPGFMINGET